MSQCSLVRPLKELVSPEDFQEFKASDEFRQLPLKIQQLFKHLEQVIENSDEDGLIQSQSQQLTSSANVKAEHFALCESFKKLGRKEQIDFLQLLISELRLKLKENSPNFGSSEPLQDFRCSMRTNSSCLSRWTHVLLQVNKGRKVLTLHLRERSIDVYLHECMLKKSKKGFLCLVLENIGFAAKNQQYVYHLKFSEKDAESYAQFKAIVRRLIVQSLSQSLVKQINEEKSMKIALSKSRGPIPIFLTQKGMRRFGEIDNYFDHEDHGSVIYKESEKFSEQTSVKASSVSQAYSEVLTGQNYKIEASKGNQRLYRAKYHLKEPPKALLQSFINCYKANHKMAFRVKVLESKQEKTPQGVMRYAAFYQKIVWEESIYGQLLLSKQEGDDHRGEKPSIQSFKVVLINADHQINRNFIQFLQLTFKQLSQKDLQVKILAKFTAKFSLEAIESYLTKFMDVFENKQTFGSSVFLADNDHQALDNLFPQRATEKPLSSLHPSKERSLIVQKDRSQPLKPNLNNQIDLLFSENFNNGNQAVDRKRVTISNEYLKRKHPINFANKNGRIMKDHFLWSNWKRAEKGGLVCKNEELVQRQKKMFKLILKKFGETLLMGKNIINFSLPVVVFKKESHLESLAKSYLYSPIFTERAAAIADPLERIKFSVILMISENALSIHMEKPFNPILGETFQGWIDGCPMYLEQISHHPPISAYYFLGRGYKKYGCIEPKVSVGLNSGSGYSILPHYVEFDDGMKIEYVCAKIVIGGLLIGERTFNFQDKIYAYDRKNRFFASVKFGPIKKGFFSSSNEPEDYFFGQIYEVTPDFQGYFDEETGIKPHPQQRHIVKKLLTFDGIWNSFININGEQVLNFKTDLPYEFQEEPTPLPSDSRYRDDLSNLLAGDLEAAQVAKEEMEEIQRRDRRLREEHAK